jgi:hypothetical protein
MLRIFGVFVVGLVLAGCAGINQMLTPGVQIEVDTFDGQRRVIQAPVSAASGLSEGWHLLGFEWASGNPDLVYLDVGLTGIDNVMGVKFNVDGVVIEGVVVSPVTRFEKRNSYRRFSMPVSEFRVMAGAETVKMRVVTITEYSVSSFGSAHKGAVVSDKLLDFLRAIDAK